MTVKRHFVEYTTTDGIVYAIGTEVDYQASNGDWEGGYIIGDMYTKVGGHETGTKWASIHKCQDAFDAPIGRLRLKVDEPASREIAGRTYTVGDLVEYNDALFEDSEDRWTGGYKIRSVGVGSYIVIENGHGQFEVDPAYVRRDQAATRAYFQTEDHYRKECGKVWTMRCQQLGLKPKTQKREQQMEAFLQGMTAVATGAGIMTLDRASKIQFMVAVGRGEEYLAGTLG